MIGPHYPIEKPKPWTDRAAKARADLSRAFDALVQLGLGQSYVADSIRKADALLCEAQTRGIKGREPEA